MERRRQSRWRDRRPSSVAHRAAPCGRCAPAGECTRAAAPASSGATPTSATRPPTKMAPVCQSCDCISTTASTATAPSTAASTPPLPTVGMSRRNARTGGVAASAHQRRNGRSRVATPAGGKALASGSQPRRRQCRRMNRPRTAHASAACAAKASNAKVHKQSAPARRIADKVHQRLRCPPPACGTALPYRARVLGNGAAPARWLPPRGRPQTTLQARETARALPRGAHFRPQFADRLQPLAGPEFRLDCSREFLRTLTRHLQPVGCAAAGPAVRWQPRQRWTSIPSAPPRGSYRRLRAPPANTCAMRGVFLPTSSTSPALTPSHVTPAVHQQTLRPA